MGEGDITVDELMERIEQVREAVRMHEERGETEHVDGATRVLHELEAQLEELQSGGNDEFMGEGDITVDELMERIEQVREAVRMHEERGETEHVEGATRVLHELEAQLEELQSGGNDEFMGEGDITVDELME